MHDVLASWRQAGVQQGGDGNENRALFGIHFLPLLQQQVMHVGAGGNQLGLHPQMQRQEGGGGLIALPPAAFRSGGVGRVHQA